MDLQQLQSYPKDRVRALVGLEPAALGELLAALLPEMIARRYQEQQQKPKRQRAVGAGRRRKLLPYQEVLLTLVYLRHNVSHAVCGQMFGVSADISERTFAEGVLLLRDACPAHRWDAEKKWTKKEPSWHPDTLDLILVDSFETPIPRSSLPDVQRRFYSGKKKRHTTKTQIITDKRGEVLAIEPGHPGPLSDKTLEGSAAARQYPQAARQYPQAARQYPQAARQYPQAARQYPQAARQYPQAARQYPQAARQYPQAARQYPQAARRADLGYQGVPEMLLPHKKKRGKAGEKAPELTAQQQEENRHAARERVPVEHGVRRVKAWRILRDEHRLGFGLFPLIASATVGLVHLSRIMAGASVSAG